MLMTLDYFGKKRPKRTFLSKMERSAPGYKAAKDRVSLLICANAPGDCMVKPMLLYRSMNPRELKDKNKDRMPVFWRANKKAWDTAAYSWSDSTTVSSMK
jgi:hypothetical protein